MNELINIKNDEAVTTSLQVAEFFHKRHDRVLRAIEGIVSNLPKNGVVNFKASRYIDAKGEKRKMYYMNRDGFSLLAMGFTGQKALEWKLRYIEAFNQMEKYINFRKADIQIQKHSMQFLRENLEMPSAKDYIKANTIADKAVSNMYGFPKMLKKEDMSPQMLADREPVLVDTVELMTLNDKYKLGVSVSKNIYKKHAAIEG